MDAITAVCRSLPARADLIRLRFWRDAEFRSLCEDCRDAIEMLAKLDPGEPTNAVRIDEYRLIAAELLAEVSLMLDRKHS